MENQSDLIAQTLAMDWQCNHLGCPKQAIKISGALQEHTSSKQQLLWTRQVLRAVKKDPETTRGGKS